jgi:hypothetical protein
MMMSTQTNFWRTYMNRRFFLNLSVAAGAAVISTPAFAGGHGRLATFSGASNHVATGRVEIAKKNGEYVVNLLDDFTFDGAPDPKIAFGNNGYDKSTLMGKLQSNTGASSYTVPAGIIPDDYNEVWIWCEKYNVPLGVAKF